MVNALDLIDYDFRIEGDDSESMIVIDASLGCPVRIVEDQEERTA